MCIVTKAFMKNGGKQYILNNRLRQQFSKSGMHWTHPYRTQSIFRSVMSEHFYFSLVPKGVEATDLVSTL